MSWSIRSRPRTARGGLPRSYSRGRRTTTAASAAGGAASRQMPNRHIKETRADPETVESSSTAASSTRGRTPRCAGSPRHSDRHRAPCRDREDQPTGEPQLDRLKVVAKHQQFRLDPQESGTDQRVDFLPRFGLCTSTISPAPTSRSTPARAGNRPRRATRPRSATIGMMKTTVGAEAVPLRRNEAGPMVDP